MAAARVSPSHIVRSLLATSGFVPVAACNDMPTVPGLAARHARADAVPAAAPNGIPDDVLAASRDASHVMSDQGIPGRTVRDRLWIRFTTSSTGDDRQTAVDAVQGSVLGGLR